MDVFCGATMVVKGPGGEPVVYRDGDGTGPGVVEFPLEFGVDGVYQSAFEVPVTIPQPNEGWGAAG